MEKPLTHFENVCPNLAEIAVGSAIADDSNRTMGAWTHFYLGKLHTGDPLQDEIGGSILVHDTGSDDSQSGDWSKRGIVMAVCNCENPISCQGSFRHVAIALLKNIQWEQRPWK